MRGKALSFVLLFSAMMLVLSACGSANTNAQGQTNNSKAKTQQTTNQNNSKKKSSADKSKKQKDTSANSNTKSKSKSNSNVKSNSGTTDTKQTKKASSTSGSQSKNASSKSMKDQSNGHVLYVTAHDFTFNKKTYVVQSGKVTIHFKSLQGTHGFALYKSASSTNKIVNIIGKGTKTVQLAPGKYYIHCSVVCGRGHGQMDAHLIVK